MFTQNEAKILKDLVEEAWTDLITLENSEECSQHIIILAEIYSKLEN